MALAGGTVYLTIDIDWAHDEVIRHFLGYLITRGVRATWFATHETPVIGEIRAAGHEIGIHPNFEARLTGSDGRSAADILDDILEVVPTARAVRSHSLTQSSRLLALFARRGLTHDSNSYLPYQTGSLIRPYRDENDLVLVTHCWTDDVFVAGGMIHQPEAALQMPGVVIIDCHPIHFFLNTATPSDYEACRDRLDSFEFLRRRARGAREPGVRMAVDTFVLAVQSQRRLFGLISDIKPAA